MNDFKGTPGYDHWIARKIGCERRMSRALLERYQVDRLNAVIRHACARSSFYKRHLRECRDVPLVSPVDLERLPFTTPRDVRDSGLKMLCVNQGGISRVVTLPTSGTTGQPKRLYFTDQDQALSLDAFVQSMSQLVRAGDLVYILLPAKRPGGVGDLLHQAVSRLHAEPVKYGLVSNLPEMLEHLLKLPIRCLVGIPVQVLALARYSALKSAGRPVALRNVLLCTDHVSRAIREEVRQIWDCRVFDYYGMTEAGFCGGMECPAHCGYHIHEADLYIEIIDPESGRAVPEGFEGEVVVSTLTRCGMPLLRYRTGDLSRFVPGFCSCGSILRRIEKIRARKTGLVSMGAHGDISMADLDEALFPIAGVVDFSADIRRAGKFRLELTLHTVTGCIDEDMVMRALSSIPPLHSALASGSLGIDILFRIVSDRLEEKTSKRKIGAHVK